MEQDVVDLLTSGEFIDPNLRLRAELKAYFERYYFAVSRERSLVSRYRGAHVRFQGNL
jgi:hypothetical protein